MSGIYSISPVITKYIPISISSLLINLDKKKLLKIKVKVNIKLFYN